MVITLAACGDTDQPGPAATESAQSAAPPATVALSVLTAEVDGCPTASVRDSGQLIYVTLPRACAATTAPVHLLVGMVRQGQWFPAQPLSLARTVGESDQRLEAIVGLGRRQVQVVRQGQWREVPHLGSWHGRDGAGLLELDGALYLLGGWLYEDVTNEVWKTTDLVHWQFMGHAPWPSRHGAGWLVHNNRLWVIGGDLYADVWSSADGVHWNQEAAAAPFGGRYTPNVASVNGEILVYAGQDWLPEAWCHDRPDCQARAATSVWKSRDGRAWVPVLQQTPWAGRALVHGSAVWAGEVYVIGGGLKVAPPNERYAETSAEFDDIWSSPDGMNWKRRATTLGFASRTHFSVLSTELGCYVSDGSVAVQNRLSHDFYFASDCVHFEPVAVPTELPMRHASSLAAFNGSLVLLGGPPYGKAGTSVWQYFP